MSRYIHPDSRISRLPKMLQRPALALRTLLGRDPLYVFESDGLATVHLCPFLNDPGWDRRYWEMTTRWFSGIRFDARWRMWVLTTFSRQCAGLPGSFVEFGVYRAGCAWMILSSSPPLRPEQRFYLFDTFVGTPHFNLTVHEESVGFDKWFGDTSPEYVTDYLSPWKDRVELVVGDILETSLKVETGPLALVHLDLNASRVTQVALEYIYPRLLPSGILVMDDYGQHGYEEQRQVIDDFFADKPECPLGLPTGQGIVVKLTCVK